MGDLISRRDLIDWLTSRVIMSKGIYGDLGGAVSGVREMVKVMPSAEPESKKGTWSNYKDEHCCSVCKCVVISGCWDDEIRYDYCPYCGADMRGE